MDLFIQQIIIMGKEAWSQCCVFYSLRDGHLWFVEERDEA